MWRPSRAAQIKQTRMGHATNYSPGPCGCGRGAVTVSAFGEDGVCVVRIADDGPGIPASDRERVFEPFVRLEESRNTETGGIGLGLAIARTIIRAHGGDITLADAAGGGLQVNVSLPLGAST